jgi:hypothetical protein
VEQLSFLLLDEAGPVRVNEGWGKISFHNGVARLRRCKRSWYPPFAKSTKDGAPFALVMPARSKAWAARRKTPSVEFYDEYVGARRAVCSCS